MKATILLPWTVRVHIDRFCINYVVVGGGIQSGIGIDSFVCTVGEIVTLDQLCDGNRDCFSGADETTPLCESKTCVHAYIYIRKAITM